MKFWHKSKSFMFKQYKLLNRYIKVKRISKPKPFHLDNLDFDTILKNKSLYKKKIKEKLRYSSEKKKQK